MRHVLSGQKRTPLNTFNYVIVVVVKVTNGERKARSLWCCPRSRAHIPGAVPSAHPTSSFPWVELLVDNRSVKVKAPTYAL